LSLKDIVFGMHVPPEGLSFEEVKNICLKAEELGYDLFTITDHFMNMAQPDSAKQASLGVLVHGCRFGCCYKQDSFRTAGVMLLL